MVALRTAGLLVLVAGANAGSQKVTPVEKVMQLMKKLSKDIEEEGKKEAKAYDEYACFCKENADEKLYNIEKSHAKIEKLTAKISKLSTEITTLNADINGLTTLIENKEGEVKTAEELRATQHESYVSADDDMQAAIKALVGAIKALKDSKGSMKGDADVDLAQLGSSVLRVVHSTSRVVPSESQMSALLQMSKQPGHAFEYQSNDILSVLENLKDEFLANKKELDEEEFQTNSDFEKKRLGLLNEIKFADKDKKEKEGILESKSEELNKTEEDKEEEEGAMNADQAFLDELTSECEAKAQAWDQRSKARSGELTALSEALESLESGAADQYAANKKLNLVQKGTSFLQRSLENTESESALKAAATQRAGKAIMAAAFKLKSPALTMVAMKVKVAADHFVKVRAVIHDLINKLEDDAEAEATQKSFCDENMQSALADRDRANAEVEEAMAELNKLSSEKEALSREIQELKDAIAANLKSLNEALELRNTEKAENEATIETSEEGKSAVELAISILEQFYGGAFLQTGGKYVPPNADREGLTVGDRAPETFSNDDYKGKQGESKGIIGLLDVILSDFERTIQTTEDEEEAAQGAFNTFEADTKTDNDEKDAEISTKENRVSEIEDSLVEQGENKENSETLKKNALKELEKLKPMCVEGEETYEQRVQKRQKEIEALKDAQQMLNDWQK